MPTSPQRAHAPGTPRPSAHPPSPERFPGLIEIIRSVETALGQRETLRVVDAIRDAMADIIEAHSHALPNEFLVADPGDYRRIELHHCPLNGYQILAMVWGPRQASPVHDHGGTWGVEAVWRGSLVHESFEDLDSDGSLRRVVPAGVERLHAGDTVALLPDHPLHRCRNPSRTEVTLTLNVYGHPLDQVGIYTPVGAQRMRRQLLDLGVE